MQSAYLKGLLNKAYSDLEILFCFLYIITHTPEIVRMVIVDQTKCPASSTHLLSWSINCIYSLPNGKMGESILVFIVHCLVQLASIITSCHFYE